MKLFQRLLVAPATLGLLAPFATSASEVNLNDISNYSDVGSIEFANSFNNEDSNQSTLLAGGEGLVDDSSSYDGSFSETTTASFSADFMLGAVDDTPTADTGDTGEGSQSLMGAYSFQIDLNTSFTGEDSLDISIDAGNSGTAGVAEFDGNGSGDTLMVDGVSYSFPVGDATVMVGDNTDGSALFTTACAYGGPSNTLDDCGNVNAGITNGGAMVGASYDFGSGFTAAFGYAGDEDGLLTDENLDAYGFNGAYTGDNYGISITYGTVDTSNAHEDTFTAFNGYYTPDAAGFPSISLGYEVGEDDSVTGTDDALTSFFVGLSWDEVGPGSAGLAMGTKTPTVEGTDEAYMYEAYYSYPINDSITITPLVFIKEYSGRTRYMNAPIDDETGVLVKTSFSF